jgi:hypothetical protein
MRFFFYTVITMLGSSFNYSVSNTYCVVFLFFTRLENPNVVSFPGLSIFDCPFSVLQSLFTH